MNRGLRLFIPFVAASLVPPILYTVYLGIQLEVFGGAGQGGVVSLVFAVAWLVSLAHLVVIGLPVFAWLQRVRQLRWLTVCTSGFLAGIVPLAVFGYPSHKEGYSSGANWHGKFVAFYENGEPTRYAWMSHAESCLAFGVLGLLAAVVFWRVRDSLSPRRIHPVDA